MTRAEWDALDWEDKAEAVATKVMGLEWREWVPYFTPSGWYPVEFNGPCAGNPPPEYRTLLPCYPFNWEDMREVVEVMEANDFWMRIIRLTERTEVGEGPPVWMVEFRCVRGATRGDHQATARTLPEAVCIAAMTARGHLDRQ